MGEGKGEGNMQEIAKSLIFFGAMLLVIGLAVLLLSKYGHLAKLPGDIYIKKGNFTFYFPIITCLLVSIIFSIILYFFKK